MSNPAQWLPDLMGPVVIQAGGTDQTARPAINFVGCTGEDNSGDDRLDLTQNMGGSCSGTAVECLVLQVDGLDNNANVLCAQTTWGIATSGIIAKILDAPVSTSDATPGVLLSYAIPESTVVDFVITVVGRRYGGVSGTAGDCYRADFPVAYQRIGSAAPTLVQDAAAETNKQAHGGGSAYAGSVAIVSNSLVVYGTGAATTNVRWTAVIQGQQVG